MLDWHPEVKQLLNNQNYQALANYYEELVENDPDEISHYWYLGLAYLLQKEETKAQAIWFIPFSYADEEQIELWNQELICILNDQACQLESQQNFQLIWIIRNIIKEINPDNLENLLLLLKSALIINLFEPIFLDQWAILDLLKTDNSQVIEIQLLLDILGQILFIKEREIIEFARACLIYSNSHPDVLTKIYLTGKRIGFQDRYVNYGIKLLLLCQEFDDQNLFIYLDLHELYLLQEDYNKAVEIINIFQQKAGSFEDKLLATCYLLNTYPKLANWDQVKKTACNLTIYCEQIIGKQYTFKSLTHQNYFYQTLMNFLYLKDDLIFHRYIFQEISLLLNKSVTKNPKINLIYSEIKKSKTLKIGYIGTTFRTHSVGFLCRWLIHHYNPDLYEVNIYSVTTSEDEITTQWFKPPKVKQFYDGEGNLEQLTSKIMDDNIDILVDLDSLTSSLTASVLLQKPAPIQITWLGLDASGLPTIDYYIADPYVLESDAEQYYREKIWRLPHTYLGIDGFEIGTPSLRKEDLGIDSNSIIFMNLQHSKKLNPDILRWQIKIVKAIPNSYLIIKKTYDYQALSNFIIEIAQSENVSKEKIIFIPSETLNITHRANLQIADVVLDTFPYNGSTTTLEALWAEIPVVTRVGEQFAARNSYTYLMNVGITEGIAWSDEEYVEWGIKLGTDANLRKEVSWKLRQSKKTSPLWNGKQFAREMENAYRQMWEIYCQSSS